MTEEVHYTCYKFFDRILQRSDAGILFGYWGIRYWLPAHLCMIDRLPTAKRAGSVRHDPRAEPTIEYTEAA